MMELVAGTGSLADDLSSVERELVEHAARGTVCDLSGRREAQRRVRADVIYELCVAARWPVHAKGVSLTGARIDEPLDFEHATLRAPLKLKGCHLGGAVSFRSATIPELDLTSSKFTQPLLVTKAKIANDLTLTSVTLTGTNSDGSALVADGMRVAGSVFLREGFEAAGSVRLSGANIDGLLDMGSAKLTGTDDDGDALVAEGLRVAGSMLLREGFEAAGTVDILGASIDGLLDMGSAKLTGIGNDRTALAAEGLRVAGSVFLNQGFEAAGAIRLLGASIDGQLDMSSAKLTGIGNDGNALVTDRLDVAGDVFLCEGFEAAGAIRLSGASIDGLLDMSSARLTGTDNGGNALAAEGLRLAGDVFLNRGFEAAGTVDLLGASIDGLLDMGSAKLTGIGNDGNALVADRLQVTGSVFLNQGFEAAGSVRLSGANIDSNLELDRAKLSGTDNHGDALAADGLHVIGSVFLCEGFEAAGAVRLPDASIGGQLNMSSAKLTGTDNNGNALVADRLHVTGSVFLHEGFEAAGAVRLLGASIDGDLEFETAKLTGTDNDGNALFAEGLHVAGSVFLDQGFEAAGTVDLLGALVDRELSFLGAGAAGRLVLEGAACAQLMDDEGSWPARGELVLRGFRFGAVTFDAGWEQRLEWVRRQGFVEWSPDPYERLAVYYTSTGDEAAARRVRVAKHDDELTHLRTIRKQGSLAYRFWRRPFGWLVGYGYRRHRAGWLLVGTLLAAGLVFRWAESEGAMVPSEPIEGSAGGLENCGEVYPCFNSLVYGADVVLPIVDLGQDGVWRPVETSGPGPLWIWARWTFIALGWALASVFAAAFTGLVQRS